MSYVTKMIDIIMSCLANFTLRFENHDSSTQFLKDITPNAYAMWVKKDTQERHLVGYSYIGLGPKKNWLILSGLTNFS